MYKQLNILFALVLTLGTAHAQGGGVLGQGSSASGNGGAPPSTQVEVANVRPTIEVVSMGQGTGEAKFDVLIEQIKAKAHVGPETVVLAGDVGHQMVQQTGRNFRVANGEWSAKGGSGIYAPTIEGPQMELFVREWLGRFYSYEHHGPVASFAAKAQGLPNAASMVVRDFQVLTDAITLRMRKMANPNVVIAIHDFSDADAVTTRLLLEEVSKRALGETARTAPLDPVLRNMATEWAARADQGQLGLRGEAIHQTLEGSLEGINYELESRGLEGEALSKAQTEQATRYVQEIMEEARRRGMTEGIPEAQMRHLVEAVSQGNELFEAGVRRSAQYGMEVAEMKRMAIEAGPGRVVLAPEGFEFVKSASVRDIAVTKFTGTEAPGEPVRAKTLALEITKPPISKAVFWTAYAQQGNVPGADLVLIHGEGPKGPNWFLGAQRGVSVRSILTKWSKAVSVGKWAQAFPAFIGEAYNDAIGLGRMNNLTEGSATIHDFATDLEAEGREVNGQGTRGGPAGGRPLTRAEAEAVSQRLVQEADRLLRSSDPIELARAENILKASQEVRELAKAGEVPLERIVRLESLRRSGRGIEILGEALRGVREGRPTEGVRPGVREGPGGRRGVPRPPVRGI